MTTMRVVGECFFWYRLTRVFPDKFHRAVKRLCVFELKIFPWWMIREYLEILWTYKWSWWGQNCACVQRRNCRIIQGDWDSSLPQYNLPRQLLLLSWNDVHNTIHRQLCCSAFEIWTSGPDSFSTYISSSIVSLSNYPLQVNTGFWKWLQNTMTQLSSWTVCHHCKNIQQTFHHWIHGSLPSLISV